MLHHAHQLRRLRRIILLPNTPLALNKAAQGLCDARVDNTPSRPAVTPARRPSPARLSMSLRITDLGLPLGRANVRVVHLQPCQLDRILLAPSRTFVANFRLVSVSFRCPCSGLIMTNMSVLELPPSENWRR